MPTYKDILSYEMAHWLRKRGKPMRPKLTKMQRDDLKECFDAIDEDGTGGINEDELMEAFKVLGIKVTRTEIKRLIEKVDRDNSGAIEFPEFIEIMTVTLSEMTSENFQKRTGGKRMPSSSKGQSYSEMMGLEITQAAKDDEGKEVNGLGESRVLPFPLIAIALRRKKVVDGLEACDKGVIRALNEKREEIEMEEERRRMLHEYMDKKGQTLRKVVKMKLDRDKRAGFFSQLEKGLEDGMESARHRSQTHSVRSGRSGRSGAGASKSIKGLDDDIKRELADIMGSDGEIGSEEEEEAAEDPEVEWDEGPRLDDENAPAPEENSINAKRGLLAGLSRRASIIRTMKNNKTVTAGINTSPLAFGFGAALGYRPGTDKVFKSALNSGPPRSNRNPRLLEAAPPPNIPIYVRRSEAYKPLHNPTIRPHTSHALLKQQQTAARPASAFAGTTRGNTAPAAFAPGLGPLGADPFPSRRIGGAAGGPGPSGRPSTATNRPTTAGARPMTTGNAQYPGALASQQRPRPSSAWAEPPVPAGLRAMTAPASHRAGGGGGGVASSHALAIMNRGAVRPQSAGMFQALAGTNPKFAHGRALPRSESNMLRQSMDNECPVRREIDIRRMALDAIYDEEPEDSVDGDLDGFSIATDDRSRRSSRNHN